MVGVGVSVGVGGSGMAVAVGGGLVGLGARRGECAGGPSRSVVAVSKSDEDLYDKHIQVLFSVRRLREKYQITSTTITISRMKKKVIFPSLPLV